MDISPEPKAQRGLFAIAGRSALLVGALTVVMLLVAVSCGGGGDDNGNNKSTPQVVVQTFTPTSEADAANRQATQDAQQTAVSGTATAVAEMPAQPTNTPDPNRTPQPWATPSDEEGLRPPYAWLTDGTDRMDGVFGKTAFFDAETGTVATILAPFYDVGDHGLTVAPGGELEFILQDDVTRPSTMTGEPESMTVSIFTWADNSAIPGDTQGNVGTYPWFIGGGTPITTSPMTPGNAVFTMPAQPDRYVVQVEVHWPTGTVEENPQQLPIHAVYAFTVYVA